MEKSKGTKKKKRDVKKDKEPQVVNQNFAENEYTGIIRTAPLGARYLEDPAAKYTWKSGIQYEGPFQSSTITGKGKFLWPDGSSYEGDLLDGKRHGEGVYIAADGVTKYEGQWKQGKRDGHGKLTYQPNGEAYYDGNWQDGRKHGEGKQVWPSKNVYEGQWEMGKMSGEGRMLWKDNGRNEEYRGHWQDNFPQGEGTHIWHAPVPKASPSDDGVSSVINGPSQQMNNRYEGQWEQGVRHGKGVFYYANGSQYKGQWEQNAKHGVGKYTFEDGRVYPGPFSHDQMVNYVQPTALNRSALNIGGEDNPVRQCIEIKDLEDFALPPDVGGLDLNVGSGYDETEEIVREVHNMLLRYLGELKQIYFQYRMRLKSPDEDPFVLSMHQLWLFARDCDLVTPSCPLSRLDRFVLSGPRQHQETAAEDMHDLRPLTPRRLDEKNTKDLKAEQDKKKGGKSTGTAETKKKSSDKGAHKHGDEDQPRAESPGSERSQHSEASSSAESGKTGSGAEDEAGAEKRSSKSPTSPADLKAGGPKSGVIGEADDHDHDEGEDEEDVQEANVDGGFWRKEDASTIQNIHSSSKVLLFRHFLEGIVRMSIARYPHEKGLEHQLRKLFKEKVLPNMGKMCLSEETFSFLVNPGVQDVIKQHEHFLWRVYKNHQTGEGGYGPPLDGPNEEAVNAAGLIPAMRKRRRGFGGQQRKAHINARYDVTTRVKDILRLLDVCGFLKPVQPSELPSDPYEPLFKSDVGLQDLDQSAVGDLADSLQNLQEALQIGGDQRPGAGSSLSNPITESGSSQIGGGGIPGFGGGGLGMVGGLGALAGGGGGLDSLLTPSESQGTLPSVTPDNLLKDKGAKPAEAIAEEEEEAKPPEPDIKEELSEVDYTLSALEAVKLLTEICSPPSLKKLRFDVALDKDNSVDECVSLLDYVETECVFIEFLRLLLRISDEKTNFIAVGEKFTSIERFACFLEHTFLPSLKKPYAAPVKPTEEPVEKEGEASGDPPDDGEPKESPKEGDTASKTGEEAGSAEGGEGEEAKIEEPEPPTLEFWRGFDEEIYMDDLPGSRHWPEGYDREVQDW